MRITADQKRQIVSAYQTKGYGKELGKQIVRRSPPEVLNMILRRIREGGVLPLPDAHGVGRPLGLDQLNATSEARALAPIPELAEETTKAETKNVLFSFKIGSEDLEALRKLSDRDGESVAVLIRQAVRGYLINRGVKR
ncbi:ribbon-helix-helix protein, CopG family [Halopseudomonas oceani]|uniref:ribbon-helix-helix protein, CopG family n=1 Tax=Halopseudomonas oceani TaxID=1708783 RepID=UPI002AA84450|nr:ribbon-helix-helix protein, CopG family [Halopseudomonas oceani]